MRILTVLLVIVNLPIILILAGIPAMIIQSTNLFLNWRAFLEWVYSFYYRIYDDNNNRCVAYGLELILCKFSPQLIQAGYFILGSVLLILIIAFWHTMRGFLLCLTLVLLLGYLGRLQWVRYYDQELRAHRITRFRDLAVSVHLILPYNPPSTPLFDLAKIYSKVVLQMGSSTQQGRRKRSTTLSRQYDYISGRQDPCCVLRRQLGRLRGRGGQERQFMVPEWLPWAMVLCLPSRSALCRDARVGGRSRIRAKIGKMKLSDGE